MLLSLVAEQLADCCQALADSGPLFQEYHQLACSRGLFVNLLAHVYSHRGLQCPAQARLDVAQSLTIEARGLPAGRQV